MTTVQNFTYHTHNNSQGIADGRNSCEEMISKAEELGFSEIGVSNHYICHPNIESSKPQKFTDFNKALDYACRDIEQTREVASRHKIKVHAGFEVDFYPSKLWRDSFEKMLGATRPDYLIGSTHNAFSPDEKTFHNIWHIPLDYSEDEEVKACLQNYWQNIIDSINSGYFSFITHFDLPVHLGFCQGAEWDDLKWKVLEAFKIRKQPFEINTSWIARKGIPSPDWQMIKELVSAQVPVLISDDAHSIQALGQFFPEVEAKLAELGCAKRFHL